MEVEVMLMNWSKNDTPSHLELCDPPGPLQNHLCPSRSATSYWKLGQGAPSNLSTPYSSFLPSRPYQSPSSSSLSPTSVTGSSRSTPFLLVTVCSPDRSSLPYADGHNHEHFLPESPSDLLLQDRCNWKYVTQLMKCNATKCNFHILRQLNLTFLASFHMLERTHFKAASPRTLSLAL